ncbi:MAG: S-layer protein [Candidatus Micrarchaeota archaeon]|nr:S-layer protein [Candidatus Micrarchaeota archaeon]
MKGINVKKIAAFAGAAVLFGAAAVTAEVMYGNTQLVDQNGQPPVKIYVGSKAAVSDGVAAANIAAKIANEAYKSSTLTASTAGTATCEVGTGVSGAGSCSIVETSKKVTLMVDVPGTIAGTYTFKTLITDSIDRSLANRISTSADDIWDSTNTSNDVSSYTSPLRLANPANSQLLYRIGATQFTGFVDYAVTDNQAASTTYVEEQSFWIGSGDKSVAYDSEFKDIALNQYNAMAYSVKFTGNEFGIPLCTGNLDSNDSNLWRSCAGDNDKTQNHRVLIKFMGSEWVISAMTAPSTNLQSATAVMKGGEVKLAKEAKYGIVNVGGQLDAGAFKVRLSDISVATGSGNEHPAIIDVLDANEGVVGQIQVSPGTTFTFTQSGTSNSVKIHVYKTAPGFTLNAKWAEMAIFTDEIILKDSTDGSRYNLVSSTNVDKNFKVGLLWKNRDYVTGGSGANNDKPDTLREMIIYNVDGFTGTKVQAGDVQNFLKSTPTFKVTYSGVDLTDDDYSTLSIDAPSSSTKFRVASTAGSSATCGASDFYWTSKLIRVKAADNLFGGTNNLLGDSLVQEILFDPHVVNASNASVPSGVQQWGATYINNTQMLFWKVPSEDCYKWNVYTPTTLGLTNTSTGLAITSLVRYDTAGDNSAAPGGIYFTNASFGYVPSGFDGMIVLQEDAGRKNTTSNTAVNIGVPYNLTASNDNVRFKADTSSTQYVHYRGVFDVTFASKDIPYVTERGSKATSISTTSASIRVAKRVGMPTFQFAYADTTQASTANEYILGVGESKVFNGVTVKVSKIDATTGSCNVVGSGQTPACTVTGGVSGIIMPNNAASVEVTEPYKLSSNLVMTDADSGTASIAILVGGPVVNTMTADAIKDASIDFNTETVVVKEIGNKVVVAGKSAADTTAAAEQFIAGIKRQ